MTKRTLSKAGFFLFGFAIVAFLVRIQFDNFYLSMSSLTGENASLISEATGATMATVLFTCAAIVSAAAFFEFDRATSHIQRVNALPRPTRKKIAVASLLALLLLVAAQIGVILVAWSIESVRLAEGATIGLNGYPIELVTASPFPQIFLILMTYLGLQFGVFMMLPEFEQPSETVT